MKKPVIRIGIVLFVSVVVVVVAVALSLGRIVKNRVESVGSNLAQVEVKLESADVWLLMGRAQLKGLSIGNPPGSKTRTAVSVGDISLRIDPISVFSQKIIIDSVTVKSPEITVEG
jgi:uncharacterized protein involved in outer membrane biogenesis